MNTDAPDPQRLEDAITNMPAPAAEPPKLYEDESLLRGRFALYHTPSGGMHLVWCAENEAEMHHVEVPAFAVKMAQAQLGGDKPGWFERTVQKVMNK